MRASSPVPAPSLCGGRDIPDRSPTSCGRLAVHVCTKCHSVLCREHVEDHWTWTGHPEDYESRFRECPGARIARRGSRG